MIVRLDDDDPVLDRYPLTEPIEGVRFLIRPRTLMSDNWNECAAESTGDILWHGGDDVVFRTLGWDEIVWSSFPEDGIAFVHGHDLSPNGNWLGTHGFVTRRWVDAVGYFCPPYFSSDFNDTWLTDLADRVDRHIYVPIVTEHLHPSFGKGEWDLTHRERIDRHWKDNMPEMYDSLVTKRQEDADKLRAVME